MQLGILRTDHGAHPPDKWARMTAWMIVNHIIPRDIALGTQVFSVETSTEPAVAELRKARDQLEAKLRDVLDAHHTAVQAKERGALAAEGSARLAAPLMGSAADRNAAVAEHLDVEAVVAAVTDAAAHHPALFAHFSHDDIRAEVRERLQMDFASVIDIERDWHANGFIVGADHKARPDPDHDPRHAAVAAWKAARHTGAHPSIAAAA